MEPDFDTVRCWLEENMRSKRGIRTHSQEESEQLVEILRPQCPDSPNFWNSFSRSTGDYIAPTEHYISDSNIIFTRGSLERSGYRYIDFAEFLDEVNDNVSPDLLEILKEVN